MSQGSESRGQAAIGTAYGLAYGLFIAGVYVWVKRAVGDDVARYFGWSAAIAFVLHCAACPKLVLAGFRDRASVVRGLLFGLSQLLLLTAQARAETSYAFLSSVIGNVLAATLGAKLLGERLTGRTMIAAVLVLAALGANISLASVTYWAIVGGLLQGAASVFVSNIARGRKVAFASTVSVGLFFAAASSLAWELAAGHAAVRGAMSQPKLAIFLSTLICAQYAFFLLYRLNTIQAASLLSFTRIPSAIGIESLLLGRALLPGDLVSAAMIIGAGVLSNGRVRLPGAARRQDPEPLAGV